MTQSRSTRRKQKAMQTNQKKKESEEKKGQKFRSKEQRVITKKILDKKHVNETAII